MDIGKLFNMHGLLHPIRSNHPVQPNQTPINDDSANPALCDKLWVDVRVDSQSAEWLYLRLVRRM
jgi:hypothetical protein